LLFYFRELHRPAINYTLRKFWSSRYPVSVRTDSG
jgi:hypothetical protein